MPSPISCSYRATAPFNASLIVSRILHGTQPDCAEWAGGTLTSARGRRFRGRRQSLGRLASQPPAFPLAASPTRQATCCRCFPAICAPSETALALCRSLNTSQGQHAAKSPALPLTASPMWQVTELKCSSASPSPLMSSWSVSVLGKHKSKDQGGRDRDPAFCLGTQI